VSHITNQLKVHNFNRYKDSLMTALKKCLNMKETMHLFCSHFSAGKVGLLNLNFCGSKNISVLLSYLVIIVQFCFTELPDNNCAILFY
jgi:hypothetical protein